MDTATASASSQEPPASQDSGSKDTERESSDAVRRSARVAKYKSLRTRTISTVAMILGFMLIIYLGHVPMALLVFLLQFLMVRELFSMAREAQQEERDLPWFRAQQWYFFFVAAFYQYFRFVKTHLLQEVTSDHSTWRFLAWILRRHTMLSYLLYTTGFMLFVLSLKRGLYLYQFKQYAWTHMILLTVFLPSSFFVSNIFEGFIWFLLPSCLIIVNDIMAYLAGFCFGRTPLIMLSPKKTWEGFIGGFFATVAFAFFLAKFMSRYTWMTCPRTDFSWGALDCVPDRIYVPTLYTSEDVIASLPALLVDLAAPLVAWLPEAVARTLGSLAITAEPMQIHAMALAVFASFVAPFGGFFASGFKRAFNMKDFGDTIPGHGGVTDRFDCQMMMAMFAFVYYHNFVYRATLGVGAVLSMALKLDDSAQVELFARLGNLLVGEGLLPDKVSDSLVSLGYL